MRHEPVHGNIVQIYGGSPKKRGSLEDYFLQLTSRLRDEGMRSVFVFNREFDPRLKELYVRSGAEIRVIPETDKRFDVGTIRAYRRLFSELRPLIANFHFGRSCFYGLVAARLTGIRNTIWTKHSFHENGPFYRNVSALRLVFSMIFLQAHLSKKVIAVSNGIKKELSHYYLPGKKVERIYLGINLERFGGQPGAPLSPADVGSREGERIIACISQARPEKGLESLIRAMPQVASAFPDVRLLVVGGGPLTGLLETLSAELGVRDRITFCGVRNDVEEILALCEFTVLPSLTEGLPLALLESICAGKPVIASNVGGIPEVIADRRNGFLIKAQDISAIAAKINDLLANRLLLEEMSSDCKERAKSFDIRDGVENTVRVYKELLDARV